MTQKLFQTDLPAREWAQFHADGFSEPVSGVIHRSSQPATSGMPLGGIDTGCVDLECDGTLGYCTIFNSLVPRRGPLNVPFLGINIEKRTWILSTQSMKGALAGGVTTAYMKGVKNAEEIHYWGHYPIVDVQYDTTAPVEVRLRAWSPFIPGDLPASSIPGAVFEVRLRNSGSDTKEGTLVFSFPGPNEAEAGSYPLRRRQIDDRTFRGVEVVGKKSGYVLGVLDEADVACGGDLGSDGGAWSWMGRDNCWVDGSHSGKGWNHKGPVRLPYATAQPGASVAVRFNLSSGMEKTIRFILAWHSPDWRAWGGPDASGTTFTHMYASRFASAMDVAGLLARDHESLLRRILAWQEVIYAEESLPVWLRDSLVNILHLITEDGLWAQAKPPIGDWCRPEDGLFGMNEDPHSCPQIECLPCSVIGNFPLVYFFPRLALSTLRGYKAYQDEEGAPPWIFGGATAATGPCDMTSPSRGYQVILNGPCYIDMVDRYWIVTGDDNFLREFYPSVKKNTLFNVGLNRGPDGLISMPDRKVSILADKETEWFEACDWAGMVTHVGGIKLASLRMVERMAEKIGDVEFAEQCRQWIKQGSDSLEQKMWAGEYYLTYWEPETGKKCDLVMANQFDGEWMTYLHGLPRVFRQDRMAKTLETIARTCVKAAKFGIVNFTNPAGVPTSDGEGRPGWSYPPSAFMTPGILMLATVYMYAGQKTLGLELCERCWTNLLKNGRSWDQTNIMHGDTGEFIYGNDYYQNMQIWTLPAAIAGQDLSASRQPGGLVDRVLQAGKILPR